MRLKNKVALVTGSSSGIGKALAVGFAREGASVIINYRHNQPGAEETARQIESLNCSSLIIRADVGKKEDVENMFMQVEKKFGKLDILVNNAGITLKIPFEKTTEEEWERIQNTNLKSVFLCSRRALPFLKKEKGSILNISSIHAVTTTFNFSCYAASKGGMEALTRSLALELGEYGIRVNALRPGWIRVERDGTPSAERYQKMCERIPLRRAGKTEDLVAVAVLLTSDEASYITGQIIGVDGGHEMVLNTAYPRGQIEGGAVDGKNSKVRL